MPSIFIWKSNEPNTSKKTIRFYSGSNWVLEESDYSSKSYIYLEQIVISESDNSVITFNSKDMPQDYIGTELLEVTNIPYEIVKSDNYGTLEKIGNWMRFISKNEIDFEETSLKNEFSIIKIWMNKQNKDTYNKQPYKEIKQNSEISFDQDKIQIDFQQFLVKYNVSQINLDNIPNIINSNPRYNCNPRYNNNNINTKYKKIKG
jgi:hypothetical protein